MMSYMNERTAGGAQWASGHPLDPRGSTTMVYRGGKTTDSDIYQVGVYGWRKRCLYFMIILLSVFIIVNMAITIWIMRVLDFTLEGMGGLRMYQHGMKVKGKAEFDKPVHFRSLQSRKGVPMSIESDRGISLNARNKTGQVTSKLKLGTDGVLSAECDRFEIRNKNQELLFATDKNEVAVKVENLRIVGDGGSVFEGAIQTSVIRPEPDQPLRLESPTRGLHVKAGQDIKLLAKAGDITATSLSDITLGSIDYQLFFSVVLSEEGEIHLNSKNLYVSGIRQTDNSGRMQYQLCVCENGRVFRTNGAGVKCVASYADCN